MEQMPVSFELLNQFYKQTVLECKGTFQLMEQFQTY